MKLNVKSAKEMRKESDDNISIEVDGFLKEIKSEIEVKLNNAYVNNKGKYETYIKVYASKDVICKAKKQIKAYKRELKRLGYKVDVYSLNNMTEPYRNLIFEIYW